LVDKPIHLRWRLKCRWVLLWPSDPIKDASQVIEAFEHLTRYINARSSGDQGKKENRDDAEDARPPPTSLRLLNRK
jgi:hypothetical protein